MSFVTYDLIFLGLFIIFVIIFLSTRKKNLTRQGIIYLYKTQLGIKFIDSFSKRFEKILRPLQYVVIACGYMLTLSVLWYYGRSVYLYLTTPLANLISAPPVAPLIPYFPKLFGLESIFPPLYFTYFIIIIGVVAVSHEFSHGIFAKIHGFKIHSTGFAFLGPILGAFVEPDEKQMNKAKKIPQLSVLAAGTFANILMTILFGLIFWLFFSSFFVPAGVKFNTYALAGLNVSSITFVGNETIRDNLVQVSAGGKNYFTDSDALKKVINGKVRDIIAYEDSPAFRAQLIGAIIEIDGEKVVSQSDLSRVLQNHKPGDKLKIKTAVLENGRDSESAEKDYEIVLGEKDGKTFLGIGFFPVSNSGLVGIVYNYTFAKIKTPAVYYKSNIGEFGWFIYYLIWWMIIINLLVALFNMLPLGILDGGRFFYLTVWGITGSEKVGKKAYSLITWILLASLVLLMIRWGMRFF